MTHILLKVNHLHKEELGEPVRRIAVTTSAAKIIIIF